MSILLLILWRVACTFLNEFHFSSFSSFNQDRPMVDLYFKGIVLNAIVVNIFKCGEGAYLRVLCKFVIISISPIALLACAEKFVINRELLTIQENEEKIKNFPCESANELKSMVERISNENYDASVQFVLKCWKMARGFSDENIPIYASLSLREQFLFENGRLKPPEIIDPCIRVGALLDLEETKIIENTKIQIESGIPITLLRNDSRWFPKIQFASVGECVFSIEMSQ